MRTKRTAVAVRRRYLKTEFSHCPHCGGRLKRAAHLAWRKKIQFLDQVEYIGCVLYRCPNADCPQPKVRFTSAAAEGLSLPYGIFGLDVLAHVGWLRDFQHASLDETWADLRGRFPIGHSTVANLYHDYLAVRAAADRLDDAALVAAAQAAGGLSLALDGVAAKAGQAHFWVLRTTNGRLILSGQWLTKVDEPSLTAWLGSIAARLQRLGIKVLATLSDHQEALVNALEAVWPDVPHQWCQSHFLRDTAEGLDKADSAFATELRQQVRAADLPLPVSPQPEAFSPLPSPAAPACAGKSAEPPGRTANGPAQSAALAAEGVPAEPTPLVAVQQEDQQLIGLALSLTERPPSGLTGLMIYDALVDVRDSLARVVVNQPGSVFQELHDRLEPILQSFASQRTALHTTLTDWRDLATCFPDPTDKACPAITESKQAIQKLQDRWRAAPAAAPLVIRFREGVAKRLTHWGEGLFVCYSVPGVPATNNDLESRFGQVKRGIRRQTGQIQVDERLRRAGSALFGMPPKNEADLLARLRQAPRSHIAAARAAQRAQARPYQMRRRFKRQRGKLIAAVEAKSMALAPSQKPSV